MNEPNWSLITSYVSSMNTARVFWRSLPEAWRRDAWRLSILLFLACSRVLYWRHYYPLVNTDTRRNSAASKLSLAHQKGLLCIGWRQAKNCNSTLFGIESIVPSLLDVPCDQPIPKGSTGVCELQTHNGTIIHAIHKACNYRHHPRAKYLTCNMAVDFLNFKHDAHAFREDPPMTMTQGSMSNGNDMLGALVQNPKNFIVKWINFLPTPINFGFITHKNPIKPYC